METNLSTALRQSSIASNMLVGVTHFSREQRSLFPTGSLMVSLLGAFNRVTPNARKKTE